MEGSEVVRFRKRPASGSNANHRQRCTSEILKRTSIPQLTVGSCQSCQHRLICSNRLTLPTCRHHFCRTCISSNLPEHSLSIFCPICFQSHIIPKEGLDAFTAEDLPLRWSLNRLSAAKMASEKREDAQVPAETPSHGRGEPEDQEIAGSPDIRVSRAKSFGANDSGCDTATTQHEISLSIPRCGECSVTEEVRWRCGCAGIFLCSTCALSHRSPKDGDSRAHMVVETGELHSDNSVTSPGNHSGSTSGVSTSFWVCSVHQNMDLRLYCANCELPLCDDCVETSYAHSSHVVVLLKDALLQQRASLNQLLERLRSRLEDFERRKSQEAEANTYALIQNREETTKVLNQCFSSLTEKLEARRSQLLEQLKSRIEIRQNLMAKEEAFWRRRIAEILSECDQVEAFTNIETTTDSQSNQRCSAFCNPAPSTSLDESKDSISGLRRFSQRLSSYLSISEQELVSQVSEHKSSSSESGNSEDRSSVLFYPTYLNSLENLVKKLGTLAANYQLEAEAFAHGEGLRYCCVGRETDFTLCIRSTKNGRGMTLERGEQIETQISSKLNDEKIFVSMEPIEGSLGSYKLSYKIETEGAYSVSIRIFDRDIRGSPFSIQCVPESQYRVDHCSIHSKSKSRSTKSSSGSSVSGGSERRGGGGFVSRAELTARTAYGPIEDDLLLKVGTKGRSIGRFTNPQDVCSTSDGKIIMTDSNTQKIQIFTDDGECISRFGSQGRGPGTFRRPTGVSVIGENRLAIADYDNRWVSVCDFSGNFIQKFGTGKMLGPKGVTMDRHGRIVVIDNKGSSVLVYSNTGKFIRRFGTRGNKPHQMGGPHFVAVGPSNNALYITDFHHHCVKAFDVSGEYLFTFGSQGTGNGQFNAPTGIAVDDDGNVLVADWGNNRIQVFDPQGSFLSYINSLADPLFGPQGMAITADGYAVVADSGNHCYKVYRFLS